MRTNEIKHPDFTLRCMSIAYILEAEAAREFRELEGKHIALM